MIDFRSKKYSATGTGHTIEEAKADAKRQISEQKQLDDSVNIVAPKTSGALKNAMERDIMDVEWQEPPISVSTYLKTVPSLPTQMRSPMQSQEQIGIVITAMVQTKTAMTANASYRAFTAAMGATTAMRHSPSEPSQRPQERTQIQFLQDPIEEPLHRKTQQRKKVRAPIPKQYLV